MCLTGNFALALMVDPAVMAPVLSQPSLPFPFGKSRRAGLHLSDEDLAVAKSRGVPVLGLRFTGDRACPIERFDRLRAEFGELVRSRSRSTRRRATRSGSRRTHTRCLRFTSSTRTVIRPGRPSIARSHSSASALLRRERSPAATIRGPLDGSRCFDGGRGFARGGPGDECRRLLSTCLSVAVGQLDVRRTEDGCPPANRRPDCKPGSELWSKSALAVCDNSASSSSRSPAQALACGFASMVGTTATERGILPESGSGAGSGEAEGPH